MAAAAPGGGGGGGEGNNVAPVCAGARLQGVTKIGVDQVVHQVSKLVPKGFNSGGLTKVRAALLRCSVWGSHWCRTGGGWGVRGSVHRMTPA